LSRYAMTRLPLLLVAAIVVVVPAAAFGRQSPDFSGPQYAARDVCPPPAPGDAQCFSQVVVDRGTQRPVATRAPQGYGPKDLRSAYKMKGAADQGSGQTIAIVDAFDDPNAESDLAQYRSTFGLPACTTGNGCFHKVGQNGGAPPGTTDVGWGVEISLDLDMASAICERCDILLVEANSPSVSDLGKAADYATGHADVVSNSYGIYEAQLSAADLKFLRNTFGPDYKTKSGQVTVSTGDDGYGAAFPADLEFVNAIGGTSLKKNTGVPRGWTEKAWSGAGSGCTLQTPHQTWEPNLPDCSNRAEADTSAVADPGTGVAVYDTFREGGFLVVGGTSASAPIIAGVYGLAENATSIAPYAKHLYQNAGSLFDVTSGSNGSCGGSELCTAGPGWDGPTGLGTPKGINAF